MPKRPGSIASEAARLSVELRTIVTPDKVRWWRKKGYDLNDIPGLRHHLRNQERVSEPKLPPTDCEIVDPTVATSHITDAVIRSARGTIAIADVLDYLRNEWEAEEWHAAGSAGLSAEAHLAKAQRNVKARLLRLRELIGIDVVADSRERLCDELFPTK